MKRVDIDGETYACPFSDLFRPHTERERQRMLASMRANGIRVNVVTYLSPTHGRAILDGMNRALYGLELGIDVPETCLGRLDDAQAKQLAISLNLDRRQLSLDEQMQARGERINRVAAASAAGQSTRQIASAEGVSQTQVVADLAAANTPVRKKNMPLFVRAHRAAGRLSKLVNKLARSSRGEQFAILAAQHGIPLDGKRWPQLEIIAAVLRDVAGGAASA